MRDPLAHWRDSAKQLHACMTQLNDREHRMLLIHLELWQQKYPPESVGLYYRVPDTTYTIGLMAYAN